MPEIQVWEVDPTTKVPTSPKAAEWVRDTVAAFVQAGANVTVTHDDAGDKLTIASSGGGTGGVATDPEVVRDTVAAFVKGSTGITATHNDAADTLTLAVDPAAVTDQEIVRDTVAAFIKAGTGISVAHDDAGNTFTITATSSGGTATPTSTTDFAAMVTN